MRGSDVEMTVSSMSLTSPLVTSEPTTTIAASSPWRPAPRRSPRASRARGRGRGWSRRCTRCGRCGAWNTRAAEGDGDRHVHRRRGDERPPAAVAQERRPHARRRWGPARRCPPPSSGAPGEQHPAEDPHERPASRSRRGRSPGSPAPAAQHRVHPAVPRVLDERGGVRAGHTDNLWHPCAADPFEEAGRPWRDQTGAEGLAAASGAGSAPGVEVSGSRGGDAAGAARSSSATRRLSRSPPRSRPSGQPRSRAEPGEARRARARGALERGRDQVDEAAPRRTGGRRGCRAVPAHGSNRAPVDFPPRVAGTSPMRQVPASPVAHCRGAPRHRRPPAAAADGGLRVRPRGRGVRASTARSTGSLRSTSGSAREHPHTGRPAGRDDPDRPATVWTASRAPTSSPFRRPGLRDLPTRSSSTLSGRRTRPGRSSLSVCTGVFPLGGQRAARRARGARALGARRRAGPGVPQPRVDPRRALRRRRRRRHQRRHGGRASTPACTSSAASTARPSPRPSPGGWSCPRNATAASASTSTCPSPPPPRDSLAAGPDAGCASTSSRSSPSASSPGGPR